MLHHTDTEREDERQTKGHWPCSRRVIVVMLLFVASSVVVDEQRLPQQPPGSNTQDLELMILPS